MEEIEVMDSVVTTEKEVLVETEIEGMVDIG